LFLYHEKFPETFIAKKLLTVELVKDKFTREDQANFTLCRLLNDYNKDQAQILKPGTMKDCHITLKQVKGFIKNGVNKQLNTISNLLIQPNYFLFAVMCFRNNTTV